MDVPPQLRFRLRRASRESLSAIAERVAAALQCSFAPLEDRMYERGEAVAAAALGLHVVISHDPDVPDGEQRVYSLLGDVQEQLHAEWAADAPIIDISSYLLAVLDLRDPGWHLTRKAALEATP